MQITRHSNSLKAALLTVFSLTFFVAMACYGGLRPVPVDVVMADGELFFVLEEPKEIEGVYVTLHLPPLELIAEAKKKENKKRIAMWAIEYSHQAKTEKKYPELEQVKYGREIAGFATVEGPFKLEKNVKYKVRIEIYGREFASEIFYITDDNKAVLLSPQRNNRAYSVTIDENGDKKLVIEPVTK